MKWIKFIKLQAYKLQTCNKTTTVKAVLRNAYAIL